MHTLARVEPPSASMPPALAASEGRPRDLLELFCREIWEKYGDPARVPESRLAQEFAIAFQLPRFLLFFHLESVCGKLGVVLQPHVFPRGLRGFFYRWNGTYRLLYPQLEGWPGARELSILHELREILENVFSTLDPAYQPRCGADLERAAEEFAVQVWGWNSSQVLPDITRLKGWELVLEIAGTLLWGFILLADQLLWRQSLHRFPLRVNSRN